MNYYVNLCPPEIDDVENLNIDVPSRYMDEILSLAKDLADERNIELRKAISELFRQSYKTLMEKSYERKNRKNAKWRGRNW